LGEKQKVFRPIKAGMAIGFEANGGKETGRSELSFKIYKLYDI